MGRFTRIETITHDIGPDGRLALRTVNGDVRVRSIDGTVATVRASYDVTGRDSLVDIPVEASPVIVRKGPGELEVETRNRIGGFLDAIGEVISRGARTTVEFDVELPRGAGLRLHGVNADLSVDGVRGSQEYHTVSGDIAIRDTAGRISIHSVSGDISIVDGAVLDVEGNTTSGDIDIRAQRLDRFGFSSVSGDIEIDAELAPGEDYRVESVTGDLQLTTVSGVELEASGPAVSVRADVPHRSDSGRGRKNVVVGDGAAHVRFRSMSGDVTISPPFSSRRSPSKPSFAGGGGPAAFAQGFESFAEQVSRRAEAAGRRAEGMARQFEAVGRRMESLGRAPFVDVKGQTSAAPAATSAAHEPHPPAAQSARAPEAADEGPIDQMAILRALERGEIDVAEASRMLSEAN